MTVDQTMVSVIVVHCVCRHVIVTHVHVRKVFDYGQTEKHARIVSTVEPQWLEHLWDHGIR